MAISYAGVSITSTDEVTVSIVRYATDDDTPSLISEHTDVLPGIWARTDDAEQVKAQVVAAGLVTDFEVVIPGEWHVDARGVESYSIHGQVSIDADAVYTSADGRIELVTLDSGDVVDQVLSILTEDEMLAIFSGDDTKYRAIGHDVEVGDGDVFRRLVLR